VEAEFKDDSVRVYKGDCLEVLRELEGQSIDALVLIRLPESVSWGNPGILIAASLLGIRRLELLVGNIATVFREQSIDQARSLRAATSSLTYRLASWNASA
jgi:hypothetical protein